MVYYSSTRMHGPLHPAAAADMTIVRHMHPLSAGLGLHADKRDHERTMLWLPYLQERLCLLQHLLELCLGCRQLLLRVCHPPHC